jgi:hypothetical protein
MRARLAASCPLTMVNREPGDLDPTVRDDLEQGVGERTLALRPLQGQPAGPHASAPFCPAAPDYGDTRSRTGRPSLSERPASSR